MSTSPRMGRGLDALWGKKDAAEKKHESNTVPTVSLVPNPNQPRRTFDDESLEELAASIKQQGIIQPILVRPIAQSKKFEIVAGERRWRAAKKAGLAEVPVFIREMTDEEVMAAALIENIQREDLTPIEEALALHSLRQECGITQEELATRLGKSRSALANTLRLLHLTPVMQEAVNAGTIQAGHARTLLSLQNLSLAQDALFAAMIEKSLSVRDSEAAVAFYKENERFPWQNPDGEISAEATTPTKEPEAPVKKTPTRKKSTYIKGLQNIVKDRLLVKTAISGDEERGRITLTYTNAAELKQILDNMGIEVSSTDKT